MNTFIIKAESNHAEIVRKITCDTINSVYPHYYPKGAVDFFLSHHSIENIIADIEKGIVYLCYNGVDAVGTVTIRDNEILRLFVLPQYQGNGYGRMLLDFAESMVLENHSDILIDASLSAKAIYLKRGYVCTEYHTINTDNGDFLCYDVMIKQGR